jgi:ATP-binding protein involved in chromosome partitioning
MADRNDMHPLEQRIRAALAADRDPWLGQDLVSAGAVTGIRLDGRDAHITIELGFPVLRYRPELEARLREALAPLAAEVTPSFGITSRIVAHEVQKGTKPLPEVRNIIAIASGKGGVGKSTTAANLALALQQEGGKVGVLDADIYGPSQTRMLASQGRPESRDGKSMEPRVSYGLQTISIGNLIEEDTPMIWRGPMVTGALEQLLHETRWRDLDYLVVDLPPGTGDIQLTLCQRIPVSGAIIVTTPQDIALLDARKGLKMFEKVNVPVLGVIENMSVHICSRCGHAEHIFGAGGGATMAEQYAVDLLGSLPLDIAIREGVDNGRPTVATEPDSPIAAIYRDIARRVAARLALRARDYSAKFPKIVIQNT